MLHENRTLFLFLIMEDVAKFVVCCSRGWRYKLHFFLIFILRCIKYSRYHYNVIELPARQFETFRPREWRY